jgi:CBS domain-containing protein
MTHKMLTVRDIMTADVISFTPETTIREAMEALSTSHLSGAPVVSGDKVVGVISVTDILSFIVSSPEPETFETDDEEDAWDSPADDDSESDFEAALSSEAWDDTRTAETEVEGRNVLDQHTVEEAMTRQVLGVTPDSTVKAAAAMMGKHGIHRVIVVDRGSLIGILSALDVARAVSEKSLRGKSGITLDPCPPKPSPWIDL